ncbi:carbohydrate porin [Blastopirellula marina]|nr:carbohydrate porin [Blastopirellula marina]
MNRRKLGFISAVTITSLLPLESDAARFKGYPQPTMPPPVSANQNHEPLHPHELRGPIERESQLLAPQSDREQKAEDTDEAEVDEPWSGTLFGERFHVFGPNQSVTGEFAYTGEVFNNAHGGISTSGATAYRGNLDLVLSIDMDACVGIPGGTFFIYGQNNHGRSITTDYVGDYQTLSNLDADPFSQISEYWWMQEFGEGNLWFKLGKQDANADFCALDLAGDFIGSSFGVIPNVPLPTFPSPGMGAAAFVNWSDSLTLKAGIYDGDPHGGAWGFDNLGSNGTFSIFEAAWQPRFGANAQLTGVYRLGVWRHSEDVEHLDGSGQSRTDNHGIYTAIDQLVYRENDDPESDEGMGIFFQYGWAPEQYNEIGHYYGGGLNYKGLIPGREDDYIGLGYAYAEWSRTLQKNEGYSYEAVVELFYLIQVTDYMVLQPDLQFISNPGGLDGRDALALGLRFEIVL